MIFIRLFHSVDTRNELLSISENTVKNGHGIFFINSSPFQEFLNNLFEKIWRNDLRLPAHWQLATNNSR